MAKKLSYQVLEDNGGGLHLAVFSGNECIWYASGLEHLPGTDVQEMLQALRDGADPVQDGWESDLPEGYTPQLLYDELTSHEYGWKIIADDAGVYPDRMGAAGRRTIGAPWVLAEIEACTREVTDFPAWIDRLMRFMAANPESATTQAFIEHFLLVLGAPTAYDGGPCFAYLIGEPEPKELTDWVEKEDLEEFLRFTAE